MITRLSIDIQGEEKTSSDIRLGPLAFREVVAAYRDAEVSVFIVPVNSTNYLLTRRNGAGAPLSVNFVLIQADQNFKVRVGSTGSYFPVELMDDLGVAHSYFLVSCLDADGIYVNTVPETRFRVWEARKNP